MTRTPLSRSKGQRSRSPGRFGWLLHGIQWGGMPGTVPPFSRLCRLNRQHSPRLQGDRIYRWRCCIEVWRRIFQWVRHFGQLKRDSTSVICIHLPPLLHLLLVTWSAACGSLLAPAWSLLSLISFLCLSHSFNFLL